jgi:NAD(P)-dependent dehydrogenase (short-subunit alcohol dehydrogenase family)
VTQTAVVTGAGGGIGSAVAAALVEDGYTVAALDRDADALAKLTASVDPERLWTAPLDVTDASAVREVFARIADELGPPTALVAIAGTNRILKFLETSEEQWDYLIELNLKGTFLTCQAVVPYMLDSGSGRIVTMSSIFGIREQQWEAAYSAAKAGIIGLTRSIAAEFAAHDITANAIAPVMTMTPRVAALPKEFQQMQLARIPMGRYGTIDDIVGTVRFLLSDAGSFYTGQTFSPNGGDTMP